MIAITLALVLVLTSVTRAAAPGSAPATGWAVLCVGDTTITLRTDSSGRPADLHHPCPDCIAPQLALPPALGQSLAAPMRRHHAQLYPPASRVAHFFPLTLFARGPPILI